MINPYEPSAVPPEPRVREIDPAANPPTGQRQYRIRMEWSTRRRFLRLVLPLRVIAIASAVAMVYGLYGAAAVIYSAWQEGLIGGIGDVPWFVQLLFGPARGLVLLWMAWLHWKLADTIVATAGGTNASMREWSRIQQKLVWGMIVGLVIGLLSLGWDWLLPQFLLRPPA